MTRLAKSRELVKLGIEANEIISKKHLNFSQFRLATSLYEYNCWIANSTFYKKLSVREYDVLLIIIKGQEERLELL